MWANWDLKRSNSKHTWEGSQKNQKEQAERIKEEVEKEEAEMEEFV